MDHKILHQNLINGEGGIKSQKNPVGTKKETGFFDGYGANLSFRILILVISIRS